MQTVIAAGAPYPTAVHELALNFSPCECRIKWAEAPWERAGAFELRRAVFCREQGLFGSDDRDSIDEHAQALVAATCVGGAPDEIVGTVRIHEEQPRHWWGSRLAVHAAFRSFGGIGAKLIQLAVSSANLRGCETFLAYVQGQNVPLFERMHWQSLRQELLHDRVHHLMQADLTFYPACVNPYTGLVARTTFTGRGR